MAIVYSLILAILNGVGLLMAWRQLATTATDLSADPAAASWARRLQWLALLWFIVVLALSASPLFRQPWTVPNARLALPLGVGLPILFGSLLLVVPAYRRLLDHLPLASLVRLHILRLPIGALFLVIAAQGLLPNQFAIEAGLGDMLAGLLAIPLARAMQRGSVSRWAVIGWSALGIADFLNALRLGLTLVAPFVVATESPAIISSVPLFGVPLLFLTHIVILRAVLRSRHTPAISRAVA